MPLTQRQAELVRRSFVSVFEELEGFHPEFYAEFFRLAPDARTLFREDLEGQGMRFMTTLKVLVDNLNSPGGLKPRYHDLGRGHAAVGATAEHFEKMGEALIATLRKNLGDKLTPELEDAWRAAYRHFASLVMEAGGID